MINEDRTLREETMETDLVTAVNHLLMTEAIGNTNSNPKKLDSPGNFMYEQRVLYTSKNNTVSTMLHHG